MLEIGIPPFKGEGRFRHNRTDQFVNFKNDIRSQNTKLHSQTSTNMIKINESNVTIMVKDLDNSISFYEGIGFELKNRWDDHYAMVSATGITIGLHPGREGDARENQNISIGLMIDKADDAKKLLDENNISYKLDDGKSGIYLHFKDPDGTVIYFTEPRWERK